MGKLRALADDHDILLERGRSTLAKDFEGMGNVENGREAVAEVRRLSSDVLVIDISMPAMDGLQAASQLHSGSRPTKIVFLTVHEDQRLCGRCFAAPRVVIWYVRLKVDPTVVLSEDAVSIQTIACPSLAKSIKK